MNEKTSPLDEAIERLKYQATAHVCTLEPSDVAEILALLLKAKESGEGATMKHLDAALKKLAEDGA